MTYLRAHIHTYTLFPMPAYFLRLHSLYLLIVSADTDFHIFTRMTKWLQLIWIRVMSTATLFPIHYPDVMQIICSTWIKKRIKWHKLHVHTSPPWWHQKNNNPTTQWWVGSNLTHMSMQPHSLHSPTKYSAFISPNNHFRSFEGTRLLETNMTVHTHSLVNIRNTHTPLIDSARII